MARYLHLSTCIPASACPVGSYANDTYRTCQTCYNDTNNETNCLTCTAYKICTSCNGSLFLNQTECVPGYFQFCFFLIKF